eukprot:scaffold88643_cov27-Tisochrysis_lutea.AAC.2
MGERLVSVPPSATAEVPEAVAPAAADTDAAGVGLSLRASERASDSCRTGSCRMTFMSRCGWNGRRRS